MNPTKLALFAAALLLPATQAFADGGRELSKKEIKLLKESSAALSSSNPDLSKRLSEYALKESNEKEENENEQAETSEKQDIKMLNDAAAALKDSRPDLSKGLKKYASKEEREQKEESEEHHEKTSRPGAPYGY